jgi:phosphatidylethanolamine-binding protein (PEBP) family uncharacterized protein
MNLPDLAGPRVKDNIVGHHFPPFLILKERDFPLPAGCRSRSLAVVALKKYARNRKNNPNCVGENVSPPLAWSNPPAGTNDIQ